MTKERIPTSASEALVLFYKAVLATDGQRFTVRDAYLFIEKYNYGVNEDSIARYIRKLRAAGKIDYFLVSRSKGLYEAVPLALGDPVESQSKDGIGGY